MKSCKKDYCAHSSWLLISVLNMFDKKIALRVKNILKGRLPTMTNRLLFLVVNMFCKKQSA